MAFGWGGEVFVRELDGGVADYEVPGDFEASQAFGSCGCHDGVVDGGCTLAARLLLQ